MTEKQNNLLIFVKNYKLMAKLMKHSNNFIQWKNEWVDVTFAREITHQKHLVQSGRSARSAVHIFNTFRVFTKEPIRE